MSLFLACSNLWWKVIKLFVPYKEMKVAKLQARSMQANTKWETQFLPSFRQRINSLSRHPELECLHLLHSLTLDQPRGIPCKTTEEKKGTSVFNRVALHIQFMNTEVPISLCWLYTYRLDSCLQCTGLRSDRRDWSQSYMPWHLSRHRNYWNRIC